MEPRIEVLKTKLLAGHKLRMSFAENRTAELWRGFMPLRRNIRNIAGHDLFSVEVYNDVDFFKSFDPNRQFDKWAAVEVTGSDDLPEDMELLILPEGFYAVFIHKGPASEGPKTYAYIFRTWLPGSEYALDNRPHFALMGNKYKHNDPSSEEEIWIPVKLKSTEKSH